MDVKRSLKDLREESKDHPRALKFWNRMAENDNGCWEWQGARNQDDYGRYRWNGASIRAHRLAYLLAVGPIPDKKHILHDCDNPPCSNPAHLFVGTQGDNNRDALRKKRMRRTGYIKLTPAQAAEIRQRYHRGGVTHTELAREFNVSPSGVGLICRGMTWHDIAGVAEQQLRSEILRLRRENQRLRTAIEKQAA